MRKILAILFLLIPTACLGAGNPTFPGVNLTTNSSTGDISNMTVTVLGGTARTFSNIIGADSTNILNILPQSSANTVTVNLCAISAGTPTATTYNVRVLQ